MPGAAYRFRHFRGGEDARILSVLRHCIDYWADKDLTWWRWSTTQRPGFVPADITVVEHEGAIVGCFHGAVHPIRLDADVEVLASIDTGFAVLPEHRRHGLPNRAHARTDAELAARGVALRGGFPNTRQLNPRFYRPRYGYQLVPVATARYHKLLGYGQLPKHLPRAERLLPTGRRSRALLAARRPSVDLAVDTLPPSHLAIDCDGVVQHAGANPDATLRVQAPYRLLVLGAYRPLRRVGIVGAELARGRLRVRGLRRAVPLLWALAWRAATDQVTARTRRAGEDRATLPH